MDLDLRTTGVDLMKDKDYRNIFFIMCATFFIIFAAHSAGYMSFLSTKLNADAYYQGDSVIVDYTYKNTWSDGHDIKVTCNCAGSTKTDYFYLSSYGATKTDSFTFTAPATGTYTIELDGYIDLRDDGSYIHEADSTLSFTVKDFIISPAENGTVPTWAKILQDIWSWILNLFS